MKRFLLVAVLLLCQFAAVQAAPSFTLAEGDDVAHRLAAFALHEEVSANDPRVKQARDWLARAVKATGEEDRAIAAACVRTAKYFQDLTRVRANPLETLEALAVTAKPGQAMSDVLLAYVETRRKLDGMGHAQALAALGAHK